MSDVFSIYVPSFFIFLGMSIVSPVLAIYAQSFEVSFLLVSLAVSIYAFARLILDLPVGMVADRFGRKPLMVAGTTLITVTSILNATAATFWEFLFYRFCEGAGSAIWMISRQTLLADMLRPEERGRVMSYFQSFMLIGSAAGPTIGGVVATAWGLRAPFYFYAFAGFLSILTTVIWVHEPRITYERGRNPGRFSLTLLRRLLMNRSFSAACLATLTAFSLMTGLRGTMIPLYSSSILGLNEEAIGTILSYATVMNLILTVPIGYAIDYFGRKPVIVLCLGVAAVASFYIPSTSSYLTISLAAVLLGVGTSGAQQAPLAMATDATIHEPHGMSMGLYRVFGDIGFILGPIIVGLIADGYGLRMPFYFMAFLILFNSLLLLAFAKETYSRRAKKG